MWKVKPPLVYPMETRYRWILESLVPPDPMSKFNQNRQSAEEEFPDLSRNFTLMGRLLTLDMYRKHFDHCTQSGVTFDDVIHPGLEEPEVCGGPLSVGCLAGDAECYTLFGDFFSKIIEAYQGQQVTSQVPKSDFNFNNLKGGDDLDGSYAQGCQITVLRNVEDFSFPTHCSRGERRKLYSLAKRALLQLGDDMPFVFTSPDELENMPLPLMDMPSHYQYRIGVGRDFPDSRAYWRSLDGSLGVCINVEDHLTLLCLQSDGNVAEAFKKVCIYLPKLEQCYRELRHPFIWKLQLGWITSSPAYVGTGMTITVRLKLKHLPEHQLLPEILHRLRLAMGMTESKEGDWQVCNVSNEPTFGLSEVELAQLVVDGVKLLINMEKRLEANDGIDNLIPAHK
ncbi:creatine kinase M-type [Pholidichthys leucotaenia]